MAIRCPECKKLFFPLKATFSKESVCLHCKNKFRAASKLSFLTMMFSVVVLKFIDTYLSQYFGNTLGLILTIFVFVIFAVLVTDVYKTH